jgi:hypothetical protein
MTDLTDTPMPARRWVDPQDLICPGCGEQVRCALGFSHRDGSPLCQTVSGAVADPIEALRPRPESG